MLDDLMTEDDMKVLMIDYCNKRLENDNLYKVVTALLAEDAAGKPFDMTNWGVLDAQLATTLIVFPTADSDFILIKKWVVDLSRNMFAFWFASCGFGIFVQYLEVWRWRDAANGYFGFYWEKQMLSRLEHEIVKSLIARRDIEKEILELKSRGITLMPYLLMVRERDARVRNDALIAQYRELSSETGPEILVYLASPYNHPSGRVRLERFEQVCAAAGALMRVGLMCYAPIAHSHPINEYCFDDFGERTVGWEFWKSLDILMLRRCDVMAILRLEGWQSSVGVNAERLEVEKMGGKVVEIDLEEVLQTPEAVRDRILKSVEGD